MFETNGHFRAKVAAGVDNPATKQQPKHIKFCSRWPDSFDFTNWFLLRFKIGVWGVVREQDRPTLWPGNLLHSRVVPPSPITWGWWNNSLGLMCLRYGTVWPPYTLHSAYCVWPKHIKHSYTRGGSWFLSAVAESGLNPERKVFTPRVHIHEATLYARTALTLCYGRTLMSSEPFAFRFMLLCWINWSILLYRATLLRYMFIFTDAFYCILFRFLRIELIGLYWALHMSLSSM